jgi:hypothetical protein
MVYRMRDTPDPGKKECARVSLHQYTLSVRGSGVKRFFEKEKKRRETDREKAQRDARKAA